LIHVFGSYFRPWAPSAGGDRGVRERFVQNSTPFQSVQMRKTINLTLSVMDIHQLFENTVVRVVSDWLSRYRVVCQDAVPMDFRHPVLVPIPPPTCGIVCSFLHHCRLFSLKLFIKNTKIGESSRVITSGQVLIFKGAKACLTGNSLSCLSSEEDSQSSACTRSINLPPLTEVS
jgi:hypothetical protein